MIPFTFSADRLTFVASGKTYSLSKDDKNFNAVVKGIKDGLSDKEVVELFEAGSVPAYVKNQGNDRVKFENGVLYVDGKQQHGVLVERLQRFADLGLPLTHLLKFIEKLEDNPSYNSRQQLYKFLEYHNVVLTDSGDILCYKSVQPDYLDWHTGTISNKPGTIVRMNRRDISDDATRGCHVGLHVGTFGFASTFRGGGKLVLVKVQPQNIVCVPNDASCQKCRTCEYEVLSDVSEELKNTLYTEDGRPYDIKTGINNLVEDQEFEDWDEYDEGDVYSEDIYSYEEDEYEDDDYDSELEVNISEEDDDYWLPPRI